jgi:hypothetical protein
MRVDMVKGDDTEVVGSGVVMTCSGAEEAGGGTEKLGAGAAKGCPPSGMEMGTTTYNPAMVSDTKLL